MKKWIKKEKEEICSLHHEIWHLILQGKHYYTDVITRFTGHRCTAMVVKQPWVLCLVQLLPLGVATFISKARENALNFIHE